MICSNEMSKSARTVGYNSLFLVQATRLDVAVPGIQSTNQDNAMVVKDDSSGNSSISSDTFSRLATDRAESRHAAPRCSQQTTTAPVGYLD